MIAAGSVVGDAAVGGDLVLVTLQLIGIRDVEVSALIICDSEPQGARRRRLLRFLFLSVSEHHKFGGSLIGDFISNHILDCLFCSPKS